MTENTAKLIEYVNGKTEYHDLEDRPDMDKCPENQLLSLLLKEIQELTIEQKELRALIGKLHTDLAVFKAQAWMIPAVISSAVAFVFTVFNTFGSFFIK